MGTPWALGVMCLVRAWGVERVEHDVLVVSVDRLIHVLRVAAGMPPRSVIKRLIGPAQKRDREGTRSLRLAASAFPSGKGGSRLPATAPNPAIATSPTGSPTRRAS